MLYLKKIYLFPCLSYITKQKAADVICMFSLQQLAESKLAKFVEDIIVPPRMVDIIVDGEVIIATSSI